MTWVGRRNEFGLALAFTLTCGWDSGYRAVSQCHPACPVEPHQKLETLPGLAPAFSADNANGIGKQSHQTERLTLQMQRFWQPLPANICMNHSWSGGYSPWKQGTPRFPWAAKHNPNPRRKLTTRGDGAITGTRLTVGSRRCLPYCLGFVLLFLRDCLSLLKS